MDRVNPNLLMKVLSEILSDKYNMKITLTVQKRELDAATVQDK